jgi:hypothetical protein
MKDKMYAGIAEATRLTQQGRLDEATSAIQRALGASSSRQRRKVPATRTSR